MSEIEESRVLPFFAKHGYKAHALSLRGHGNSDGQEAVNSCRFADYVEDVGSVIAQLRMI